MKFARYRLDGSSAWGVVEGETISVLSGDPYSSVRKTGGSVALSSVKLLAPAEPTKIVCVGLNYRAHCRELGMEPPVEPVIFIKPASSVIGPGDAIRYPDGVTRLDHEAELAIVIGSKTKGATLSGAPAAIFGYTCLNDITARDLQKKDGQWTRSKSFDTFCPIGPWIETELDPSRLKIRCVVNGTTRQDSSTRDLIFGPSELVSFISGIMTLFPGDIIATGTPSGVGAMSRGDAVDVEIEAIGVLRNHIG